MSWYNTPGPYNNYVLFSKVRYVRNLSKQNFPHRLDTKRAEETLLKLDTLLSSNGFRGENIACGVTPTILSLSERQLVEYDFAYSEHRRALYLNDPCNLVIAIGGEDFISISSVVPGLSVIEAKNMASEAEDMIDREFSFAYIDNVGYLTANVSDCGSGFTISAAIYLPSLRLANSLEKVRRRLSIAGMTLAPMFNGAVGDLYILSYTPHYLSDEDATTVHFSDTVVSLIEKEKSDLGMFFSGKGKIIYADARRALGSLLYSESVSECEMLTHLSSIRLCHCLSAEAKPNSLPSISELNYLTAEGLNASVIVLSREGCASIEECEAERSSLISGYIQHNSEVK